MQDAVIFDVDGTLCNVKSIRHLVTGKKPDFDAFHKASASCPPHNHVVRAAHRVKDRGDAVLIVTARMTTYRNITAFWLAMNHAPSDALYMRAEGDFRKDYVVKKEILEKIRSRYNPVHAWDDNPAVLKLWQEEGIPYTRVPGWA